MAGSYPDKIKELPLFDGRFDAHKLAADNCDVLFASYSAGTSIPPHTHATDNYGVITKGELILTMDGKTQHFKTGDWYHVPARLEHSAEFLEESDDLSY